MTPEQIFDLYKVKISTLVAQYMERYKSTFEHNSENALKFLEENYEEYRKDVATIGTNMIHEHLNNGDFPQRVAIQNQFSIGALAQEMFNLTFNQNI